MSKCTNPELGKLLHAYELDTESEEQIERFEIHLLECEHCFNQWKSFRQEIALLSLDDDIKQLTSEMAEIEYPGAESPFKRFWRYIWPETHFVFKPALSYILILFMIIPSYWGIRKLRENRIHPVQAVSLFPDRSGEAAAFRIGAGEDCLLSFVFRGALAGKTYHIIIRSEDGESIFQDDTFDGFDEYETGRLLLSISGMKPGSYHLTITDPGAGPPFNSQEYSFGIEK